MQTIQLTEGFCERIGMEPMPLNQLQMLIAALQHPGQGITGHENMRRERVLQILKKHTDITEPVVLEDADFETAKGALDVMVWGVVSDIITDLEKKFGIERKL